MRTVKFLAAALAVATVLGSCSKDDISNDPGAGSPIASPTYATFTFRSPGATGRATETGGAEADAASEKKIKEYRLLVFDVASKACEVNVVIDATAPSGTSKTVLLNAGQKKIFALANMQSNATLNNKVKEDKYSKDKSTTLDQFLNETFDAGTPGRIEIPGVPPRPASPGTYSLAALFAKDAGQGFPMSSTNFKTYTVLPNISAADAEAASPGTEAKNNFKIEVEFMLAKAGVHMQNVAATNATVKVNESEFTVRNLAKSTFLIQQFQGSLVKSYYHTRTWADYKALDAEFDYASAISARVSATPDELKQAGRYVYVAENTNNSLTMGQASHVSLKTVFLPHSVITAMTWSNAPVATTASWANKPAGTDRDYFMLSADYAGAKGTVLAGAYYATLDVLKSALSMADYGVDFSGKNPVSQYKVIKYAGGISYYRINIGETNGASTKFGVDRGRNYVISVKKITGPGFSTESGLISGDKGDGGTTFDPDTPVETETNIVVSIEAKGWKEAGQDTDL